MNKSTWWKQLGTVAGGLLMIGFLTLSWSEEPVGEIIGGCVIGIGIITAVVYFMMKQNSDEAL